MVQSHHFGPALDFYTSFYYKNKIEFINTGTAHSAQCTSIKRFFRKFANGSIKLLKNLSSEAGAAPKEDGSITLTALSTGR